MLGTLSNLLLGHISPLRGYKEFFETHKEDNELTDLHQDFINHLLYKLKLGCALLYFGDEKAYSFR